MPRVIGLESVSGIDRRSDVSQNFPWLGGCQLIRDIHADAGVMNSTGHDLRVFKTLGFRAVGLDLSPAMARIAHLYTQAPIVVGDLRALPFADRMFKGAWAAASMLHLRREDFGIAILEARRVLAVDGLLFLSMKLGEGESQ